jgi:pimeloyl-ACP methyl ester carboxylesterase
MAEFTVSAGGVELSGEESGDGPPVVLLHGLTATRNYVIHGSRALERAGRRVISYDARGHGASGPTTDYDYASLARDLEAVLDDRDVAEVVLAGASMGAHTAVRFALDHPDRVRSVVVITPAFDPDAALDTARWDRLAEGLRSGGIEGFVAANSTDHLPEKWRETVVRIVRQRMSEHQHLDAVADALQASRAHARSSAGTIWPGSSARPWSSPAATRSIRSIRMKLGPTTQLRCPTRVC